MRKETQKVLILSLLGLVSVNAMAQEKAKRDTIKSIDEVVVTALGIKRQEKALGYAAQTMKEGDVLFFKKPELARLLVNGLPAFDVQVGTIGAQTAVQVERACIPGMQ